MKMKEFKRILNEHCKNNRGIEVHKNDFKILSDYIIINDTVTLHGIHRIHLVGDEKTNNKEDIVVWFNNHNIQLSDLNELSIGKVKSYLKK